VPEQTRKALYSKSSRFAPLPTVLDVVADPGNLALIPVLCLCPAIVAAETNLRLALVLALAALLLIATRTRHAVTLAALLVCAFTAATLLHVPQISTPPIATRAAVGTPASGPVLRQPREAHAGGAARRLHVR
jgi:hypothetical protein